MPVLSEDSGLHETLALLTSQLRPDSNHKDEMGFLRDVFSEKSLSYLMKIHEKLRYYERQSPTPVLHSAVALAEDVMEELQAASVHSDERELLQLLSTPHLRVVTLRSLFAHTACVSWDGGRRERSLGRETEERRLLSEGSSMPVSGVVCCLSEMKSKTHTAPPVPQTTAQPWSPGPCELWASLSFLLLS